MTALSAPNGIAHAANPQGQIPVPIEQDPRYQALLPKIGQMLTQFPERCLKDPKYTLFPYKIQSHEFITAAFNHSLQIGNASKGINAFGISAALSAIALERPHQIAALNLVQEWPKEKLPPFAVLTPFIINKGQEDLLEAALDSLFDKIEKSTPCAFFVPCLFKNNEGNRAHWVFFVVEKKENETIVSYVNTRGGNHEITEPENRTLASQEKVLEEAVFAHFDTPLVRNPDFPIARTTHSCGIDCLVLIERLMNQNGPLSPLIASGGLLEPSDLASPEQTDLANRSRYAEKFISFFESVAPADGNSK